MDSPLDRAADLLPEGTAGFVDHIGIAVRDLDEGIALFGGLLGLALERVEEVPREHVRVAFLKLDRRGALGHVELLAPTSDQGAIAKFIEKKGPGLHHVALAARDIELITARNLADVLRACATDDAMIQAALRCGYFDRRLETGIGPSPHDGVIRVLSEQLDERFWDRLRAHVLAARADAARDLLHERTDFQVRTGRYPPGFGIKLANLLRSVPAATRQRRAFFPLIPHTLCFRLAQLADEAQASDATMLVIAASGMLPVADGRKRSRKPARLCRDGVETHFEALMTAISAETLAREIGMPIEEARISFSPPSLVIEDNDLFTSTCTSFFLALTERLAITPPAPVQADSANELLAQAFSQEGGIDAAWEEARFAVRGGMRFVLDRMTDTYKQKLQVARVKRVLEQQLNQLQWTERRALMQRLLSSLGSFLPSDLRGMDPARLVRECDRIAWAYVIALDRAAAMFRRY